MPAVRGLAALSLCGALLAPWLLPASPAAADPLPVDDGPTAGAEDPTADASEDAGVDAAEPGPSPATAGWAGTVELYGFAPLRTTGDTTVRGFTAETDLNLGQALSLLDFGAALRGSVEKGRLGALADVSYVRLGAEKARTGRFGLFSGSGEVTTIQGLYDLALRYRFGDREAAVARPGHYSVIPYAGIRLVQAELGVSAELLNGRIQAEGNLDRTWVQPLLGTQASVFLSPRLQLFARADAGGFGLSGAEDLSGNAQLGFAYAVGNSTQLRLSWRYFGIDYNNGGSPDNGYSSDQNGIEAGLKLFF